MVIKRLFEFDRFLRFKFLYIGGMGGGRLITGAIFFFTGSWAYKWGGGLLIGSLRYLEPVNDKDTLQGIPQVKMNGVNFHWFVMNK